MSIQANNRKSCISMPDLEQIQAKFRTPRNNGDEESDDTNHNNSKSGKTRRGTSSGASSNNSSASRLNGEADELAEFETKEFPSSDHESSNRHSQLFDDSASTSSSQEASMTPLNTPYQKDGPTSFPRTPVIQVEGVDEEKHHRQSRSLSTSTDFNKTGASQKQRELDNVDSVVPLRHATNSVTTSKQPLTQEADVASVMLTKVNQVYGNPVLFWLLLVLVIIPIAYIIQMSIEANRSL